MKYISLLEILSMKVDINGESTLLLSNKILITKPKSLQQNTGICDGGIQKKIPIYPYRETNKQHYILRKGGGISCSIQPPKDKRKSKVYEIIRPYPRTSIPNRRVYKYK